MTSVIQKMADGTKFLLGLYFKEPVRLSVPKRITTAGEADGVEGVETQSLAEWFVINQLQGICPETVPLVVFGNGYKHLADMQEYWDSLQIEQRKWRNVKYLALNVMRYLVVSAWDGGEEVEPISIGDVKKTIGVLTENKIISDELARKYISQLLAATDSVKWDNVLYQEPEVGDVSGGGVVDISEEYLISDIMSPTVDESFYIPVHISIQKQFNLTQEVYKKLIVCWKREYDNIPEWELIRGMFCEIERETWKRNSHPDLHDDIESLDLYMLKKLLMDRKGGMFRLYGWQCELLLAMKRFTNVVASRRAGKTTAGTYLGGRQMYVPESITTYVVPSLTRHARAPLRKYEKILEQDFEITTFHQSHQIKNARTKAELQFYSTVKGDGIRSDESNLLIFDEVAYIKEKDYLAAYPLVSTTKGMIYSISTFHRDNPQNWWYYRVLEGEVEKFNPDSQLYTKRIPISENPFFDEQERENIAREYERDPKGYQIEYLCVATTGKVFNLNKFWSVDYEPYYQKFANLTRIPIRVDALAKYHDFYIGYDPGKLQDEPGLTIVGRHNDTQERKVLAAAYLANLEYLDQALVIADVFSYFTVNKQQPTLLMEANNTGEVVHEILTRQHKIPHKLVKTYSIGQDKYDNGVYTADKSRMVSTLQYAIMHHIQAFSFMKELRTELEAYDPEDEGKTRSAKEDGGSHHFDILSALRLVTRYLKRAGKFYNDAQTSVTQENNTLTITYEGGLPIINFKTPGQNMDNDRVSKFGY